ncbi:hypothetical protein M7I_0344 [Glarea lozoyensis 74030]|uniref:LsmAD domain-containing protein n=1 Tax=Glarea lozoyensis (strain ATCC 74030 / MF5533) TaxID=1104152 RepID=H0ED44_GLAL7|nr:hypothetical protein M7I_0344 [Glarea lozoyensis 74030]
MSNGGSKYQTNMSNQRKDMVDSRAGVNKAQNGNSASFRTDSAISGSKGQGERVLQRWVPDAPEAEDGSLESTRKAGPVWDQFAENERRFGLKSDYDENIYTTPIDKSHPQYKQRVADADKKAKEIERSVTTNVHVAEERITDNLTADSSGLDEEDKYSGVRRPQDFPPLSSSTNNSNKYTPPARRAPTGQSTVSGAPVDPAIISSQLARPDKPVADKKPALSANAKGEVATPPTTTESSVIATPDSKPAVPKATPSATNTVSPKVTAEGSIERDVAGAFRTFALRERTRVESARISKARNDKELKLSDLKKFADSFKLNTPVPEDLIPIIAKDPVRQQEIKENAKRNAEAKPSPAESAKPIAPIPDAKAASQRPVPSHGTPSSNMPNRQTPNRNAGFPNQGGYNSQNFRGDRSAQGQQIPVQQGRGGPGNLGARLRSLEQQKHNQMPLNPMPIHEARLPPTGPSNGVDPNFSRRSSGVNSAQGGRLNPMISEFRPSPFAASFNPNAIPSSGSSPRTAANAVETPVPAPIARSLLKRKPIPASERPSLEAKFDALEHIMSIKPGPGRDWSKSGGLKPAFDTPPTWRQVADDEKPGSTMHQTYKKLFEEAPFANQAMSSPNPSHAVPPVPHQHQLPFHLQQGVHNMNQRQSPRQPSMNLPNQHGHGPAPSFNGPDEHRMMPSQSAQSFASPRLHNIPVAAYPSPMNQSAQLYNPQMVPFPGGGPPLYPNRSLSGSHQFIPQQTHMGPTIMMQNPTNGFMTSQGMAPGPQMMYPPGQQGHFIPQGNGPPIMPVNGYPSPGRGAPMMMSQGSQQGHQQPPMFGVNPGMSPGPQYGQPVYAQAPPNQSKFKILLYFSTLY